MLADGANEGGQQTSRGQDQERLKRCRENSTLPQADRIQRGRGRNVDRRLECSSADKQRRQVRGRQGRQLGIRQVRIMGKTSMKFEERSGSE